MNVEMEREEMDCMLTSRFDIKKIIKIISGSYINNEKVTSK